ELEAVDRLARRVGHDDELVDLERPGPEVQVDRRRVLGRQVHARRVDRARMDRVDCGGYGPLAWHDGLGDGRIARRGADRRRSATQRFRPGKTRTGVQGELERGGEG